MTSQMAQKLFSAGTCGATITRELLRSLALEPDDRGTRLLDAVVEHPLVRTGFEGAKLPAVVAEFEAWLGGSDVQIEYRHIRLVLRALDRLAREPDQQCLVLAMTRAYTAGDKEFTRAVATRLLESPHTTPAGIVRAHDMLGIVYSSSEALPDAVRSFAAAAAKAGEASMDQEEWDSRTKLAWCHYRRQQYLEALREIDLAEPIARRLKRSDAVLKTLIDRGNVEQALGRLPRARDAYQAALLEAERANDRAKQSDALGNLGNVAYQGGDLGAAEAYHRRALAISRRLEDRSSEQYDLNNLAAVLWEQKRSEEAASVLAEALQIARARRDAESVEEYSLKLGSMNDALGRYGRAGVAPRATDPSAASPPRVPATRPALAQPHDPTAVAARELELQVRLKLRERDAEGARGMLQKRLALEPGDWRARSLYGALLDANGEPAGARAQYAEAIQLVPDALDPYYRLVDSHRRTDELESMLHEYERGVRNEPFRAGIRLALALAYAWSGQHDRAIQQGQEAIQLAPTEELPLRVLAEAQMLKARSLLKTDWDGAWMAFAACSTTLFQLIAMEGTQAGEWCAYAGSVLEDFAHASHSANPPLLAAGMEARELEILAKAARFYRQAHERDEWRATERYVARIEQTLDAFGSSEELALAADRLRLDGWQEDAVVLLMLSLRKKPEPETQRQLESLLDDLVIGRRAPAKEPPANGPST